MGMVDRGAEGSLTRASVKDLGVGVWRGSTGHPNNHSGHPGN